MCLISKFKPPKYCLQLFIEHQIAQYHNDSKLSCLLTRCSVASCLIEPRLLNITMILSLAAYLHVAQLLAV